MAKRNSIDLFAGAGGLSVGFGLQGFNSLFANDHEKPALQTYIRNHPNTIATDADIEGLDPEEISRDLSLSPGELDVLLGGPPCQGFSTYGRRDPGDHRNRLFEHYCRFLETFRPKAFVIENVTGILSMQGGEIIEEIVDRTSKLGYEVQVWTLNAMNFGVPQSRKRVFVVGGRGGKVPKPIPTHGSESDFESNSQPGLFAGNSLAPTRTVKDAISDLPEEVLNPRDTHVELEYPSRAKTEFQRLMRKGSKKLHHHSSKRMLGIRRLRLALMRPGDYGTKIRTRLADGGLPDDVVAELLGSSKAMRDLSECRSEDRKKELKLREMLKSGQTSPEEILAFLDSGGFANKYRRLKWESPSHTLVAHMARDCSDFVHPHLDRFVSVREAARLQSFPDNYYFEGSQFQQFRQIGNAVPPLLGAAIAGSVCKFLGQKAKAVSG